MHVFDCWAHQLGLAQQAHQPKAVTVERCALAQQPVAPSSAELADEGGKRWI